MTDTEINIAIAESQGWTMCRDGRGFLETARGYYGKHPNYANDIDAMVDAVETLEPEQREWWCENLELILGLDGIGIWTYEDAFKFANAKARERAKAFLIVIGKWIEQPTADTGTEGGE